VPTDFDYVSLRTTWGSGWSLEDKAYTYKYYNKQNYNGTTITATSATDKLNSYRKYGNLLPLSQVSKFGVFRTGLWSEVAFTDRYQVPSDPRTWVDALLPNFHEKFTTTTLQAVRGVRIQGHRLAAADAGREDGVLQAGLHAVRRQRQDGRNLGGLASVNHVADYHTWLPSFDAHYLLGRTWSVYGQYSKGQNIPPSSVFDVKNAAVSVLPNPTLTDTYQSGTVFKASRFTLDVDVFRIRFENDYSSAPDATGEPVYYLAGAAVTKGVEAESNILFGVFAPEPFVSYWRSRPWRSGRR